MPYDPPDDPAFWPTPPAWTQPATERGAGDDAWPTPEAIEAKMDALAGPNAERVDLGVSREGRPISGLRISHSSEPAWSLRILGAHHGDEPVSATVALRLAERLVTEPGRVPDGAEVWIVPVVNPDGLAAHTRVNAAGVDLNRNYDYQWGAATNPGSAAFSEPETRAIRALTRARSWLGGLSLHSGATNIGWPWNYTTAERAADEPRMTRIGEQYLSVTTAPDFWATNGADWYATHGDSTDWAYGRWGIPEFTVELSDIKAPADPDVVADWHIDALLAWIARPPDFVADARSAATNEPIPITADAGQPARSPNGGLARWSDGTPLTWSSAGFATADFRQPLIWNGAAIETRVLSRGDAPMTVPADWIGLSQPGEPDFVGFPEGVLDVNTLGPGLWDVHTTAGIAPRSLIIGEVDDRVRIDDAALTDGVVTLWGQGFGRGAEAWGVGGPVRAMHRLTPLEESSDRVDFLWAEGDDAVLLWTNGAWVGAVGMNETPKWDENPPATEVIAGVDADTAADIGYYAGGCKGADAHAALGFFAIGLTRRRRKAAPA